MDLELNEIQLMLADSIEKFIANDYDFDTRQQISGSDNGYSDEVWKTIAELGWTFITLSEEDGGYGGGPVDLSVVMERFGRGLVVEPYLANIVLACGVLRRAASDKQKSEWLQGIAAGELQATLAFVEPSAGYELADVTTQATRDGSGWRLSGEKGYVLNAGTAELIIVPARSSGKRFDESGISLFAVTATDEGVSIQSYETVDGHRAAEVTLDSVFVDEPHVIGAIDQGFEPLRKAVDEATLAVCAEAIGIMTALTEKTIEYTKNRVQFGVPISSFQSLQHRMVEMYTACEQSRSLLMWAAIAMTDEEASRRAVHSLKYQIGVAGKRVGEEAVQIHGGMGVTWELDVAHYFKRLTAIGVQFGSGDWHLDRLTALKD